MLIVVRWRRWDMLTRCKQFKLLYIIIQEYCINIFDLKIVYMTQEEP